MRTRIAMDEASAAFPPRGTPRSACDELAASTAPAAAGIVFVAKDGDVLLLRRSADEKNYGGHWGLPGGKAEDGESACDAAIRETLEEIKQTVGADGMKVMDRVATPNGMVFTTFARAAEEKFVPVLDGEHSGYCWASLDQLPQPLHPSVARTLGEHIGAGQAQDMTPADWAELKDGFAKWVREEEAEPEHAADSVPLAMDKRTMRSYTADGFLQIARTPISKANVCDYYGREIPNAESLGLIPDKKYKLLRDTEELAKAAASFNGVPLLIKHTPVNADDHRPDLTVGSVGTSAEFEFPYLYNALTITAREGIVAVESEEQKELSSGYRYRADMTPGTFHGEKYDGVMRDIGGNHVALVTEGRAGPDVAAADEKPANPPMEFKMAKSKIVLSRKAATVRGAIGAFLLPKMATDAQPIALDEMLKGVTAKNFKSQKGAIITAVTAAVAGKLAKDAKVDDLKLVMDALEDDDVTEGADENPETGEPMTKDEMEKAAKDEAEAEEKKAKDEAEAEAKKKAEDESVEEPKVTKAAMDAAIKTATETATKNALKLAQDISEAQRHVKPFAGELAHAFDSVEGVYRAALTVKGVKVDGMDELPAAALKAIIDAQPIPGQRVKSAMAQDAQPGDATGYASRFPAAEKIGTSI